MICNGVYNHSAISLFLVTIHKWYIKEEKLWCVLLAKKRQLSWQINVKQIKNYINHSSYSLLREIIPHNHKFWCDTNYIWCHETRKELCWYGDMNPKKNIVRVAMKKLYSLFLLHSFNKLHTTGLCHPTQIPLP